MDLLSAFIISLVLLIISIVRSCSIAYPLLLSLATWIIVFHRRGIPLRTLIALTWNGSRKSFPVLNILFLIGATTAVWMAAGTVPALVYYGLQLINPQYFILLAFILTSCISTLLGTSFGAVSTMGVALMIMARGSSVSPHLIAGTIIAGAYFGDRCSPMSSSANLIASLTGTKIHRNIRNMIETGKLPFIFSSLVYLVISVFNPVKLADNSLCNEIVRIFHINLFVLIPALVIMILALFQVEVKLSLSLSIISGMAIAIISQGYSLLEVLQFTLLGFESESTTNLKSVMTGGGVISMLNVSVIVVISTGLAGLLSGTKVLESIKFLLKKVSSRSELFLSTILVGTASSAFGCTQTIAIVLTQQLLEDKYKQQQLDNYQLATDIENTAVVLSPLIPWNIAGLVPATILMTDAGFIPFATYLYFVPLFSLIQFKLIESTKLTVGSK